ncbi:MAG: TIGR02099 family protein [Proteobacteria bacterium]|nr:TIGR02099 family protein [Pseudomonadota bacterium]
MRAHLIRGLHHARRGVFYVVVVALILMAVAVAIADRLLPLVREHPDRIAAWLITHSGRHVQFASAEAHWTSRGPLFTLHDVRIGKGADRLAVDRAELLVAMYSGVLPDHPFTELRLQGLALTVERDADGRWRLVGLSGPRQPENHNPLATLEGLGELQISGARLSVRIPAQGFAYTTPEVALRMRVTAQRLRAGVRVNAPGGAPLLATLDLDRRSDDGSAWIGSENLNLAPWADWLAVAGARVEQGRGKVQLWLGIHDSRVTSVQVDANLRNVRVSGHAIAADGSARPTVDLSDIAVSARWRMLEQGWDFVAPVFRLRTLDGRDDRLDGIALRSDGGIALAAPRVDGGLLLALGMLSDRVPAGLRDWLLHASPRIRLSAVRASLAPDGTLHGSFHLDDASWEPVGNTPALHGVAGSVLFDRDAIAFTFDKPDPTKNPFRLLWPPAYGPPIPFLVDGDLTVWRDGGDWVLESSDLHTHNEELDMRTRIAMRFRSDGRKPRLDLFATVQPARMIDAKHYWLRNKMHASTVAWLDNAIEDGRIAGAHAMLGGDLGDWPFHHDEGRFEAVADLVDGRLHFEPDWPRAEHLAGRLAFVDSGMRFDGTASILGLQATQITAQIPSFPAPILDIRADVLASGPQILALLRQSPLVKKIGAGIATLDLQGSGLRGNVHLTIPLKHELGQPQVEGDVDLSRATLADPRWNVSFTDVAGRVHFEQTGVLADGLDVKLDGAPAKFRLAVGEFTKDPAIAVDATVSGLLPAAVLIARAPMLGWLKPILDGRGVWTVQVKVPEVAAKGGNTPSQLSVSSDLRGVLLKLPAPLAKAPAEALSLEVSAPIPASAGETRVRLGDVLEVRGSYDDRQAFRGTLAFGGTSAASLPAHGLVATGHVDTLDAAGWVALAGGAPSVPGAADLQTVDVQADELLLGGRHFADTRLRMNRHADATILRLDGEAIAGGITVPSELARGIHAQFDRLYWPGPPPASTQPQSAPAAADADIDPTKVPPLHVEVTDLRFGDAKLGHLLMQTHPVAQGLRIDQLDTASKSQTIDASGDWLHVGGGVRTRLSMNFKADSLGKMLDAFGFKGVVAAGKTKAILQASWPGSPSAFRMAALDGTLDLDVGEGRLLEVKPGAGRILGLVSLAELPRRLTLDFRDFFDKGFSFDSLRGHFAFADGKAHADKLTIKGPAADIIVRGDADLIAQTYDQTIDVLPKAGGLVTAVGAAVGGPVGAAVGAVAGEVLKKPLQHMAHKRYHVTGPWAHPEVKVVPVHGEVETTPTPSE